MGFGKLPHVGMQYEHQALFEISDTFPDH